MLKQLAFAGSAARAALVGAADRPLHDRPFALGYGMIKTLFVALLFTAICSAPAAARKVALVIGNGAYKNTVALTNPVHDARAMADKLTALGFEVTSGYDEDIAAMQVTVGEFARKAVGADIALMFYAGHGIQVHGDNFLIPTDAKFEDETSLDFETIPVNFIIRQMSRDVKVRVIILDACRNNPLARSLARAMGPSRSASVAEGLAEIKIEDPGEGTVIAFATSPGDVAYDGDSSHSPFTSALLKHIDTPDLPIQNMMTSVTRDVYNATKERQRPWVNASLISEVYLNQTAATEAPGAAAATATEVGKSDDATIAWEREKTLFESAQKSAAVEDYRAYLAAYPQGQFAEIARNFINRAEAIAQGAPAAVPEAPPATVASLTPADMARAPSASSRPAAAAENTGPAPGTSLGEAALGWDAAKRREIQKRLALAGQELGRPDGNFGARTRTAISAWQRANNLEGTGFFTGEQFQMLVAETQDAYERPAPAVHDAASASHEAAPTSHNAAPTSRRTSAGARERTRGKATSRNASPTTATTNQQRPARHTNAPQRHQSPPAAQVENPFGSGHGSSFSDDPCLVHPGHRIIDGVCIY